jgi:catechol 2,3-dioxygenase-like lactoylglutathione lyase family enzyme
MSTADTSVRMLRAAPCFVVADVFATAEHYRDVLGFRFDTFFGDPPSFVILWRDDVPVMLKQGVVTAHQTSTLDPPEFLDAYFWVDDLDALAGELRSKGADIVVEPTDREIYDGRDLYVRDVDGHILCFGQVESQP